MKTKGTIQSTADLIYGRHLYQNASVANVVTTNAVTIDLSAGNMQSLNLAAATGAVTVTLANQQKSTYVLVVKQHSSTIQNITFSPTVNTTWSAEIIGAGQYSAIVLTFDGTAFHSSSSTSNIAEHNPLIPYGIGAIVVQNAKLYRSIVQIPISAFNAAQWEILSGPTAYNAEFVIADWTSNAIVVNASVHNQGANPITQVFEGPTGGPYSQEGVESILVDSTGNVTINIIPGVAFDGKITIK